MPKLQISLPSGPVEHALTEEAVTIGRAPDNTLVIDDPSVSSHHAQLTPAGDSYILQDLGSTNGTRLNGKGLGADEKHTLKPGDKVRFGKVDVVYDPENAVAGEEAMEMPEANEAVAELAEKSVKPTNFMNASPFQKKTAKKDPVSTGVMVLSVIALLTSVAAAVLALQMKG